MPRLIYGHDAQIAAWVAARIPHVGEAGFGLCRAIGVASDSRMLAGVVFHDWQPGYGTMQLSFAAESPMWARPQIVRAILAYPFSIGVFKLWTATPHDHAAALKVNERLGFKREGVLAHHFGSGRHAVVRRMLRPTYERLYGEPNGQVLGANAA